ncbi:phage portal protein [Clostridium cylindrosporum]|uniref:Phage portal protein SPP1 n=1 Tax=Clostridium cylindrosporum DSM 605 TaxID=1121307 RepID=A0A0J8D6P4_CLOCY|nr:phage portal protein [Clostridium cylindrosporum]KMT21512.1 phage portal protein SPP1 [Clostridium cylindrosporum DSM 605]
MFFNRKKNDNNKQDNGYWFEEEVKKAIHTNRVAKVLSNKAYIEGKHKILSKPDEQWKGETFKSCKVVLQEAKTILNFHTTYLLGNKPSIIGSENMVRELNKVYRDSNYHRVDFNILSDVLKYGDAFEYVYFKDGKIVSKIIPSQDSYPVIDRQGIYTEFVEHWKDEDISHYNVYTMNKVESYNDEDGQLRLVNSAKNITGLPIHYSNAQLNETYGRSELDDIVPILDLVEEIISKLTDAIYKLSINSIPVLTGQELNSTLDAGMVGSCINLEMGSTFSFANSEMDYNSIKLLLDTLHKKLNTIAGIPSIVGSSNISNVSETSLGILYSLSSVKAMLNEQFVREGMLQRYEVIRKLLEMQGVKFNSDDYCDIEFVYSKPINNSELLDNLKKQWEMGAISLTSIIEKSTIISDTSQELERLELENKKKDAKVEVKEENDGVEEVV